MRRHTWSDIKARTTPEVRTRIEGEMRLLSEDIRRRMTAGTAASQSQKDGGNIRNVPDKHSKRD
jgi:hypothetical protein